MRRGVNRAILARTTVAVQQPLYKTWRERSSTSSYAAVEESVVYEGVSGLRHLNWGSGALGDGGGDASEALSDAAGKHLTRDTASLRRHRRRVRRGG